MASLLCTAGVPLFTAVPPRRFRRYLVHFPWEADSFCIVISEGVTDTARVPFLRRDELSATSRAALCGHMHKADAAVLQQGQAGGLSLDAE